MTEPTPDLTPMMRQYREAKRRYPDHLLLFRLGDFYEMFEEDARTGAAVLQIALTSRQGAPMAGIPHQAAESYIGRLLRAGLKVAVCDQTEAPGPGRRLLRREITRVISPGTVLDPQYLDGRRNNFLLAAHRGGGALGVALVDLSTGEFWVGEAPGQGTDLLEAALLRRPAEILLAQGEAEGLARRLGEAGAALTRGDPAWFGLRAATTALTTHFQAPTLEAFGLGGMTAGVQAAGAALAYLRDTQGERLSHLARLTRFDTGQTLVLDPTAVATLELTETLQEGTTRGALIGVLDETLTPMGARLLRQWLLRPLLDPAGIRARQDAVAALVDAPAARAGLRQRLGAVGDLERLTSRAAVGLAHARDLVGLRDFLRALPAVREGLKDLEEVPLLSSLAGEVEALPDLAGLLEEALEDEPPLALRDGGLIREGYHPELAALRRTAREAKGWIAGLEARERERTGIPSLKVRFNRVFGYAIEVPNAHAAKVPPDWVRRQTLTGAERYVTPELGDYERRALAAEQRMARLEYELFEEVRARVAARAGDLLRTARALGALDALQALAEVAHARGWTRPEVDEGTGLSITEGRHPVLERGPAPFTPNDAELDPAQTQIVILTGPNMSGKSVYMRQVALLVILAQMGSWIPARAARIGLVDRILTRVGAQDNLARGQSTFLVEMVETASILHNATPRSLILLDEVGRGTSTFDGLAIAWAVTEELHEHGRGAKVLFATHYHELTALAERLPRVRNFHVAVREWQDEIIFLHRVRPGGTDRSYGIQVARLAGLPPRVIERARQILAELGRERAPVAEPAEADPDAPRQLPLFPAVRDPIVQEIQGLDLSVTTPLEALNLLARWQRQIAERS